MIENNLSKLSLYSIFHGNLNYSSIDKELYEHIIDTCYWPIIDLVNEYNFKPAIEFPINTILFSPCFGRPRLKFSSLYLFKLIVIWAFT